MWSSAAADHVQHGQLDCAFRDARWFVFGGGSEHSLYNHPSIEIVLWENPSRSVVMDILRHIHLPFVLIHSA